MSSLELLTQLYCTQIHNANLFLVVGLNINYYTYVGKVPVKLTQPRVLYILISDLYNTISDNHDLKHDVQDLAT